jgi:hypothetical protein
MTRLNPYRQTIKALIISTIFILLSGFYYHIDKYLPGILVALLTILIPVVVVIMVVSVIKGLILLFKNFNKMTIHYILPILIYIIAFVAPFGFDSENFESRVLFRACYKGPQSHSIIKFRNDKTFEVHSTGIFFSSFWYLGKWNKIGDTLFLKFNNEKMRLLKDTMIIRKDYLVPVTIGIDSIQKYNRYFYLGYCKGHN